jgi:hypothetical protein
VENQAPLPPTRDAKNPQTTRREKKKFGHSGEKKAMNGPLFF